MKRKAKSFDTITSVLQQYLGRHPDYQKKIAQYTLFAVWEEVVGERIAKYAQPLRMNGNTLILRVANSSWMQELQMLKPELLSKIHTHVASNLISDIRLELGKLS